MSRALAPKRLGGLAAGGVAAFLLAMIVVPPSRGGLTRILVVGLVGYACVLGRAVIGTGERPDAVAPPRPLIGDLPPADEPDVRMARLDASLAYGAGTPEQWSRATRPMLRRLATERLRTRTGIDPTADPTGARRLMGEELWQIFATPPEQVGPPPGPEGLRRLVAALERL